jgi:TolB-like protein/tetratricopeptide (TPR) repeat protein
MGIIKHLRERRLFQIAVSYIAFGWVVLEVFDQLTGKGILPVVSYHLAFIWFVVGIGASLLIGWHHGEKGKQRAPVSEVVLLAMLGLVALGMSGRTVSKVRAEAQRAELQQNQLDLRRIAVMYFRDDSPDGEYRYLADGITEELIAELTQVQGLSVISRNGTMPFRGQDVSPDSVAKVLEAGTVVEGIVEPRGKRLRIHISLIEGQSGAAFERVSFDMDAANELVLGDSVVEQTGRLLRSYLGEEVRLQRSAAGTRNTAAWALLQRGEKASKDAEAAVRAHDMHTASLHWARADSLLAEAQELDRDYPDPSIARAFLWYRQARLAVTAGTPAQAVPFIEAGVKHADEALRRSRTAARAYDLRGTLNYFRWVQKFEHDAAAQEKLLQQARVDLETAVRYDPLLASAHSTLSHLHYTLDDLSTGLVAAQKAYEADMYLEVANDVLWRLFNGSVGLGNFSKARTWCDEGLKRFKTDSRLVACRLWLMITPGVGPGEVDIDTAWAITARAKALAPSKRGEHLRNEQLVAGAIARAAKREQSAALADSARAVLRRAASAITAELDPTRSLLLEEAYVWVLLGDKEKAVDVLYQHAAADPHAYRHHGETSWFFRDLESDPRFRELFGLD